MFYHTVIVNSPFCDRILSARLRHVNFQKKSGRACDCKRIDWCGCSPNFFRSEDFVTNTRNIELLFANNLTFFARKFDPVFNQRVINALDTFVHAKKQTKKSKKAEEFFWMNVYASDSDGHAGWTRLSFSYRLAFTLFYMHASTKHLTTHLTTAMRSQQSEQFLFRGSNDTSVSTQLRSIHALFRRDTFAGFVLRFDVSNESISRLNPQLSPQRIELFYTKRTKRVVETVNESGREWHNTTTCSLHHFKAFFAYFRTIEVRHYLLLFFVNSITTLKLFT